MVKILTQSNNVCNVPSLTNSKANNSPRKVPSREFSGEVFYASSGGQYECLNNVKFEKNVRSLEKSRASNLQHNIHFSVRKRGSLTLSSRLHNSFVNRIIKNEALNMI